MLKKHKADATVPSGLVWLLQFESFARGFMTLCGGPAIHLFSATELERLVCGNPILNFEALQANSRYDGGYSAEHRVWSVDMHSIKLTQLINMQFWWAAMVGGQL